MSAGERGGSGRPFPMVSFAVDHANHGYHVFPLRPRTKEPYARSRGLYDATTDERRILHMWDGDRAESNIAANPDASGAFIIDVDSKHGADPEDIVTDLGLDLHAVQVWTSTAPERSAEYPDSLSGVRGGQMWFRGSVATGKTSIKGVEVRGVGAYGILPPSRHPWGDHYDGLMPRTVDLPSPPASVAELVASMPTTVVKVEDGTVFEPGGRHEQLLAWARSRYTAHGVLGEAALLGMLKKNEVACRPPLPADEVRRLWRHLENTRIANRERDVARLILGWRANR